MLPLTFLLFALAGCGSDTSGDGEASALTGTGTAVLSWTPPTTNSDGSPVNLAGFRIYVGTSPTDLQYVRMVSDLDLTSTLNGLVPGTYFFAVTAVSDSGAESAFSNIESKTIA